MGDEFEKAYSKLIIEGKRTRPPANEVKWFEEQCVWIKFVSS